jgi:hypothetical protein
LTSGGNSDIIFVGGDNVILELQRYGRYKNTQIDKKYINSSEYRRKFDRLTDDEAINSKIYYEAKKILTHRSGTEYEDLTFINAENGKVLSNTNFAETALRSGKSEDEVILKTMPTENMKSMSNNVAPHSIIAIHNHPGNSLPSLADLRAAVTHSYKSSVILAHNGTVYKFTVKDTYVENLADFTLGRLEKSILSGDKDKINRYTDELADYGVILEVF